MPLASNVYHGAACIATTVPLLPRRRLSTTVPLASLPRCRFYHGAACLPRCRVYHGALTDGDTVCQRELFGTIAAEKRDSRFITKKRHSESTMPEATLRFFHILCVALPPSKGEQIGLHLEEGGPGHARTGCLRAPS